MTTLPSDHSHLTTKRNITTEQQLALFIREILSRMDHSYDPLRGNHSFMSREPFVMTDELKGTIDGLISSLPTE